MVGGKWLGVSLAATVPNAKTQAGLSEFEALSLDLHWVYWIYSGSSATWKRPAGVGSGPRREPAQALEVHPTMSETASQLTAWAQSVPNVFTFSDDGGAAVLTVVLLALLVSAFALAVSCIGA